MREMAHEALSDSDLHDMGMHRCACGEPVYPDGSGIAHCETQAKIYGENIWQFANGKRLGPEDFPTETPTAPPAP